MSPFSTVSNSWKGLILFFTCTLCISCAPQKETALPTYYDINAIVRAAFIHEEILGSYNIVLPAKSADTISGCSFTDFPPISTDLVPLKIINVQPKKEQFTAPPDAPNSISVQDLLNLTVDNKSFFASDDSTYFFQQTKDQSFIPISDTLQKSLLRKTNANEQLVKSSFGGFFLEATIPILSANQNKAYLEITFHCPVFCGYCNYLLLERINGTWVVKDKGNRWIS